MTDNDNPAPVNRSQNHWTVEVWEDANGRSPFGQWFNKLDEYDQAVVDATIKEIVMPLGMDICQTEWGKPLKDGLYEIRIRRSLATLVNLGKPEEEWELLPAWADKTVLLRIFCTFHGNRIVLLFQGYDKGKDPSPKRQQREIKQARKHLRAWKNEI